MDDTRGGEQAQQWYAEKPTYPRFVDLTWRRFGRLLVLGYLGSRKGGVHAWAYRCDCGTVYYALGSNMVRGLTSSCGCAHPTDPTRTRQWRNGAGDVSWYSRWAGIVRRCTDPRSHKYHNYGARGITVAPQWVASVETFIRDLIAEIGDVPFPGAQLDRINNDGNYEPGNVRWATRQDQMGNTRLTRYLELNGERLSVSEWSRRTGKSKSCLFHRIKIGWSDEAVLTTPVAKRGGAR